MAKRELEEINASSMADIAFLLLVFFLVTTTFNKVKVIPDKLPQKADKDSPVVAVHGYNILDIIANKKDEISLENEVFLKGVDELGELTEMVKEFYVHPRMEDNSKWPEVYELTEPMAQDSFNTYDNLYQGAMDNIGYKSKLAVWTKRLKAVKMFGADKGSIPIISDKAVIAIEMDNTTKYITYIMIMDAIMAGINDLKEELVQDVFNGRTLSSFDARIDTDKEVLELLDVVYPKRVMKKKGIAGTE